MTSEPLGGNGERAGVELIEKDLSIVRSGYAAEKASDEVKIQMLQEDESLEEVFPHFLNDSTYVSALAAAASDF